MLSRVNVLELMSQGAWAAPLARPCKLDDEQVERTTLLPSFTWSSLSTFCFPGGYHHGSSSCHPNYTATDLLDYSRFNLVLVQGQNFTRYTNGSWRATQQAETAKFAEAMNHLPTPPPLSSSSPSLSAPTARGRKVFPYIGFYAPAAWYEAQARFNDPQSHWEDMWLRDSQGLYGSMIGGAGSVSCSRSTQEGGNYAQYKYRRLYDWRKSSARKYFTEEVVKFILENPLIGGAFFDDVNTVADISLPCDCPNCKCEVSFHSYQSDTLYCWPPFCTVVEAYCQDCRCCSQLSPSLTLSDHNSAETGRNQTVRTSSTAPCLSLSSC